MLTQHLELALRDGALSHGETDSELCSGDVARTKTVEVAEELSDADSLLLASLTNSCNHIFAVVRQVPNNFSLADACLSLRVVVEAVVEALVNAEELITTINILAEVNVVDLIDIALVHVASKQALQDLLGRTDAKQVEHAKELLLCDMAVAGDVVVLKDRLQVDALVLHLSLVLLQDVINLLLHGCTCQVLATSKKSVVLSDGGNTSGGILVDALNGEG